MPRLFIFSLIVLYASACKKKEKIVEVEKDVIVYQEPVYKWKRVKEFGDAHAEFIKTARRTGQGFIFFTSIYDDIVYDSIDNKFHFLEGAVRDKQLKPLITNSFKLELYDGNLNIVPHNNLPDYPLAHSEKQIYLGGFDSTLTNIYLGGTIFQGEVCGNDRTLLVEYNYKGTFAQKYIAMKLKFDLPALPYGNGYIGVETFKIFKDELSVGTNRFIGPIGDNLLFMMGYGKNYLINAGLDTVYINNTYTFNDLFTYNMATYSFAGARYAPGSAHAGQTCLIKTTDNGLTWQEVAFGLQPDMQDLTYSEIGTKIIAFSFLDQIWEINITENGFTAKELDNNGLTNKRIKAITSSNNRVFISTESGVFERPYNEFIDYK